MSKLYSKAEEIANGISHGIGVVFGFVALSILLILSIRQKNIAAIISFSIYGACLIIMFASSTLYHALTMEKIKRIFRLFDHSAIFLFIAGTYTPIAILSLKGPLRLGILIGIWLIAFAGVVFKVLTYGKFDKYNGISLVLYIGMGWIALIPIRAIVSATSLNFFYWILAGGILYSLGTIFYSVKKIPYNHAIWHIFVLAASVTHFLGIVLHLT